MHPSFRLTIAMAFMLALATLQASPLDDLNLLMRDKRMSIYGIKNADKNGANGVGLFYSTQDLKVKAERSDFALKTAAMIQTNPFHDPLYINIGGNYMNEKILGNGLQSDNFDQYSGALAIGYYLKNDLYVEAGKNVSVLNGSQISPNTGTNDSISKETYAQLGKRFETPVGTIDTQMKGSQIYRTLSAKEKNYESSVNYYLNDAIKVGYVHSVNQNEISDGYSIDLGYFSTQYTKAMTQDTYNVTLGLKANFTDIANLSTYQPTSKVKKTLSKSQKFDNIILQKNMRLRR